MIAKKLEYACHQWTRWIVQWTVPQLELENYIKVYIIYITATPKRQEDHDQ